ncbi:tyrosine-type recombinase/integrase [Rhodoferax sp.]|uniref:tyrosine-type recombinase/integrase n=1 Tax=Rhodoferax sp. TaxID=50421 RepID=UPI0027279A63|nr:tyrosine-type recombinase/integrase [Rhodoferax sp.]MDO8318679.1 tyrosine-type recombinase/integrase [Rhodoferax sp.]MDP2677491.1 tyrosine-type recombinase/integrase [Rhodoferax sp.]
MRRATAPKPPSFAALVQQFFTEYLVAQRAVSPRTVACYRDALMLFLDFASGKLGKAPTAMRLADIQPDLILAFLDHLEHGRKNSVRSRNLRLTALRAFLKFAGRRDVTSLHDVERALAVPMKRFERPMLGFLSRTEMVAVLGQPGPSWSSQRDHLLLAMLYNTGARVSEIIGVRVVDVVLDGGACVHLHGKGRKLRSIPLWAATVVEIRAWMRLNPTLRGEAALLPNRDGQAMSRSNVAQRLDIAVKRASAEQPNLLKKRVSPHTLRHTSAMHLLQSGVPFNVIALWLGHESTTTTHRYVEADLAMKEKALGRLEAPDAKLRRYQAPDSLMRFLQTL